MCFQALKRHFSRNSSSLAIIAVTYYTDMLCGARNQYWVSTKFRRDDISENLNNNYRLSTTKTCRNMQVRFIGYVYVSLI